MEVGRHGIFLRYTGGESLLRYATDNTHGEWFYTANPERYNTAFYERYELPPHWNQKTNNHVDSSKFIYSDPLKASDLNVLKDQFRRLTSVVVRTRKNSHPKQLRTAV